MRFVAAEYQCMDLSDLIDRYCQVWTEPNAARCAELLASVWAAGATYTDPSVHAANAEALLSHIAKVQARRPGSKVVRVSGVDADGTVLPDGLDVAFVSPDGEKIERIIGFFGPLRRASE